MNDDNLRLEIGHILFIDIVGYSKFSVNDQHARVGKLNQLVRASEEFRKAESAGRLLKIATESSRRPVVGCIFARDGPGRRPIEMTSNGKHNA